MALYDPGGPFWPQSPPATALSLASTCMHKLNWFLPMWTVRLLMWTPVLSRSLWTSWTKPCLRLSLRGKGSETSCFLMLKILWVTSTPKTLWGILGICQEIQPTCDYRWESHAVYAWWITIFHSVLSMESLPGPQRMHVIWSTRYFGISGFCFGTAPGCCTFEKELLLHHCFLVKKLMLSHGKTIAIRSLADSASQCLHTWFLHRSTNTIQTQLTNWGSPLLILCNIFQLYLLQSSYLNSSCQPN